MSLKHKNNKSPDVLTTIQNTLSSMEKAVNDVKVKLDKLQATTEDTKNHISDVIIQQNKLLCNSMAENNTGIKTVLDSFWKKPKHGKLFPISSSEELLSWNESINEENKDEMVKTITAIIGEKGLIKGLPLIINEEILFEYNMEGIHGKKRFKTFKNILDVLYLTHTSSMVAANSPKSFDKHIRIAFKHLKNRHFKNISVKKKKIELELKKM